MEFSGYLIKVFFEADAIVEPKYRIGVFAPTNTDDAPSEIIIKGNWEMVLGVNYRVHGCQIYDNTRNQTCLLIDGYNVIIPTSPRALVTFLASDLFPTIDRPLARKIIENFADKVELLDFLSNNQDLLINKLNLSASQADQIIREINEVLLGERAQEEWEIIKKKLEANDIKTNFLKTLLEHLSLYQIVTKLKSNPYSLTPYLKFKILDQIFLVFHNNRQDPLRIGFWLEFIIHEYNQKTGDTKIKATYIKEIMFKNLLELTPESYDTGFKLGLKYKLFYQSGEYLVLAIWWHSNNNIIGNLKTIFYHKPITDSQQVLINYKHFAKASSLTDQQFSGFNKMLTNNVTILTGGPGTGKTQIIKAVVDYLNEYHADTEFILAAPTGKAAQNLEKRTGFSAKTLHSIIGWKGDDNYRKNYLISKPLHQASVLIIDEFSMVSNWLFGSLLQSIIGIQNLILIGDPLQLPSIQPGAVLRDLINSKTFTHHHLLEVFRQEEGSAILKLIKFMEGYQNPDDFQAVIDFDFKQSGLEFNEFDQPEAIEVALLDNYRSLLNSGLNPIYDMQVVIPQRKNKLGTTSINQLLQANFNPHYNSATKVSNYNQLFFLDDKVMQIRNDYERHVMNGNIGQICKIYKKSKKLTDPVLDVQFLHKKVSYNKKQLNELDLAYACTVHKVQGSEFPAIIAIITQSHSYMLKFKLIYTMVSRAQNTLILIGQKNAMMQGLEKRDRSRQTLLPSLIRSTFYNI